MVRTPLTKTLQDTLAKRGFQSVSRDPRTDEFIGVSNTGRELRLGSLGLPSGVTTGLSPSQQPLDKFSRQFGAQSVIPKTGADKLAKFRTAGLMGGRRVGGGRAGQFEQPKAETSGTKKRTPAPSADEIAMGFKPGGVPVRPLGGISSEAPRFDPKVTISGGGQSFTNRPSRPEEQAQEEFQPQFDEVVSKRQKGAVSELGLDENQTAGQITRNVSKVEFDRQTGQFTGLSPDPEVAEAQKASFNVGGKSGGFDSQKLNKLNKLVESKVQKRIDEQQGEITAEQKAVSGQIATRATDIGLAQSPKDLQLNFEQDDAFVRENERQVLDLQQMQTFNDKQFAEQQFQKNQQALRTALDRQKRDLTRQKRERVENAKQRLAATGRLTTDAAGNLDAESQAMLDRITADANEEFNDSSGQAEEVFQSELIKLQSDRDLSIRTSDKNLSDTQIKILRDQSKRQQDFVNTMREQGFEVAREERAEERAIAGEERAEERGIAKEERADARDDFQLSGTAKDGFILFNKQTGEAKPLFDGGIGAGTKTPEFIDLSAEDKEKVFALGKMVFGTRISDAEGKKIFEYLSDDTLKGKSRYDLSLRLLGFTPENNKALGEELITKLVPYVGVDGLPEFPLILLGQLLDAGRKKEAIDQVENFVLRKAKEQIGDDFVSEFGVRTANRRANELLTLVDQLEKTGKNPIGARSGTVQEWLGRFKSKDAQKVATKVSRLMAGLLPKLLGTNATAGELTLYEGITPQLRDRAENFKTKLQDLRQEPLKEYNDLRASYLLPNINENSLHNKDARVPLYEKLIPLSGEEEAELAELEGGEKKKTVDSEFIKDAEGGFQSEAFDDFGRLTIGFGTPAKKGEKITEQEATRRFDERITQIDSKIDKTFTGFNENQRVAIQSFMFNLGTNIFDKTLHPESQRLLKALIEGNEKIIREEFIRFNQVDGEVVEGLTNRRNKELTLFFTQ